MFYNVSLANERLISDAVNDDDKIYVIHYE